MTRLVTFCATAALLLTLLDQGTAAPIQGGAAVYEIFNEFQAVLIPGTPFNPGPDPLTLTFISTGILESNWSDQVGNTIDFEHTSVVLNGSLPTDPPTPFQNVAGIDAVPALGPYGGQLIGVVQDPSDPGFATGDPSSLSMATSIGSGLFGQFFGPAFLYSASPYPFEGTILGLPYPVGTEFVNNSAAPIDIFFYLGIGPEPDPSVDLKVAEALPGGIVRITRVVPEPASILLAIGCLSIGWLATARRI